MTTNASSQALDVIVVGAGQAGLAVAYHLSRQDTHFLVLDAGNEIGQAWRTRWDLGCRGDLGQWALLW